jgi:hypothetical protein
VKFWKEEAMDIDLTKDSTTFPNMPEHLIPRDTLVKWLQDRFSAQRRVIIVQGPDGSGKTTLLAQFAKTCPARCFTFFVRMDYWTSRPAAFLRELCKQMRRIIPGEDRHIEGDYYELRELFGKLYHQVARRARRVGRPFYFVIDGLECVRESAGPKSIIDLLPHDPLDGIYLLASSASGKRFGFEYHTQAIQHFSPTDTASYLNHIGVVDKKIIERIYEACGGMPGYLDQIRREIEAGIPIDEILTGLPSGFQELLEREWKRAEIEDEITLKALAILAYSQSPLDIEDLAALVGLACAELRAKLASAPQVQLVSGNQIARFVTDAHRRFVANELRDRRIWTYDTLIPYHEQKPLSETSQNQLSVLYRETGRFNALTDYVSSKNLVDMLRETHDLFSLRKNVQIVADVAYDQSEWQILFKYALMSSVLKTLSTKSAGESEVDALLALDDYQESLELAYQAPLPEDQLQLLARICSHMKQKEDPIPNQVLSDLERLVSEIDPRGGLRERLIEISADLFYAHPQAAKNLVERVAGTDSSGRLMDVVLTVLAVKLEGEAARSAETLRSRISDQSLQDFARANSPIVADFTVEQVLTEANRLEDTSGKLFMLRSWCNANRENPEAIEVVDCALEIMTASTDYSPSMRHLRQFAEPLLASDEDEVFGMVDRFDLLKDTAIEKPAEEAVRLELVLASIESNTTTRLHESVRSRSASRRLR